MPLNPKYLAPFVEGDFYHVFNRSPSNKKLFYKDGHYQFFLDLVKKYLLEYVNLYSYCLIPNHFHLLLRVSETLKPSAFDQTNKVVGNQFRKLFIAYGNSLNKEQDTHGSSFVKPFRRIQVPQDADFSQVTYYIHSNAVHHGICKHPSEYPHSSYNSILSDKPTLLKREEVLEWFGGRDSFVKSHKMMNAEYLKTPFALE